MQQLEAWKVEIGDDEAKFAEIARTHSVCPSRQKGGDLGEFGRGEMQQQFEAATMATPVGSRSEPFHSDSGLHILYRTK